MVFSWSFIFYFLFALNLFTMSSNTISSYFSKESYLGKRNQNPNDDKNDESSFKRRKLDKINQDDTNNEYILDVFGINGLIYIPNFLSNEEEENLIENINTKEWSSELKRRVQHYGYKYNYKSRSLSEDDKIGDLPLFFESISKKLQDITFPKNYFSSYLKKDLNDNINNDDLLYQKLWNGKEPNQIIVNEYLPGQGISSHTDSLIFEDHIVSVSIESSIAMNFIPSKSLLESNPNLSEYSIVLERRSAIILSKDARYKWKHCIKNRKSDKNVVKVSIYSGDEDKKYEQNTIDLKRNKRISLTFRRAIISS